MTEPTKCGYCRGQWVAGGCYCAELRAEREVIQEEGCTPNELEKQKEEGE